MTCVVRPPRSWQTGQSAVARSSRSLATRVNTPLGSTISKRFCWCLKPHQPNSASPQRGRSEVSSARCAERASEAGARGRTNKVSGRLITAILFGSAARRCSWENRIFCYQMTVRFEGLCAETHACSRTVADASSATSEKLNDVRRVRNCGINRRAKCSLGRTWLFGVCPSGRSY